MPRTKANPSISSPLTAVMDLPRWNPMGMNPTETATRKITSPANAKTSPDPICKSFLPGRRRTVNCKNRKNPAMRNRDFATSHAVSPSRPQNAGLKPDPIE